MPKTDFVDFKAIKASLRMEQVLSHYHLLDSFKRIGNGESLTGPCPIHKGSNPSQFRVSLTKNVWNCFSECKHGGNVLDFIAKMENVSIHAAALKALSWFNLPDDKEAVQQPPPSETSPTKTHETESQEKNYESVQPNPPLKFKLEKLERSHPYLSQRGLTTETIINFGLGYCTKGLMKDRIAIPVHDADGNVVAYAGRWPGDPPPETEKYKFPPGFKKSQELFNLDRACKEPPDAPWFIVEGFFGCMHLVQNGLAKVIALMGSSISPVQEQLLVKFLKPSSRIVLLLDEDDAGRKAREQIAPKLAKYWFTKIHVFGEEGVQPDALSSEEISEIKEASV